MFPLRSSLKPGSTTRTPLHFHRAQKLPRPVGMAPRHPELRCGVPLPHLGSPYSRTPLEDSGIQIHSAFRKGSRASILNDRRRLNEYENMCPSSFHVSRVVNRHRGTVSDYTGRGHWEPCLPHSKHSRKAAPFKLTPFLPGTSKRWPHNIALPKL